MKYFNCSTNEPSSIDGISGNDIQSKVMAFAFGLSAEIERNLISQRTKASLDSIKARGKKSGRPFAAQSKKLKLSKNIRRVKELLDKSVSKSQIARIMDVQTITLRRFIQRMGWRFVVCPVGQTIIFIFFYQNWKIAVRIGSLVREKNFRSKFYITSLTRL